MINKAKELLLKYKSQILYLFFGGVTTVINIVAFFVLNSIFKINYQISNVIAWILCVVVAYITNKIWVFESKTTNKKDLARETLSFLAARILTLVMEFVLLYILVEKLLVLEIISKVIVNILVIVANYFLSKLVIFNSNIKFNVKKILKVTIPTIIIIMILGVLSYQFEASKNGYDKYFYGQKDNQGTKTQIGDVVEIKDGAIIEQKLEINDNAKYVTIGFADEDSVLSDTYSLKVIDENKKIVLEQVISNKLIYSNKYTLDISSLKKGEYVISLKYNKQENDIKLFSVESEKNKLNINGQDLNRSLDIYVYYKNNLKYIFFYSYLLISLIVIGTLVYFITKKNYKIENKFLVLAIPIFLMYVFIIPINKGHDEMYHWYRVFEISEGNLVSDIKDGRTGAYLPANFSIGYSVSYKRPFEVKERIDYNDKIFFENGTMAVYNPLQYYPQLLGVVASKHLTNNQFIIFYIARLFNMVFSIAFLYLAIKRIPYMKKTLFVFAFIPIAIEGFTTLSGDGILIAMAYYFIAYILSLKEENKQLSKKDQIILFILSLLISSSKLVYVPIIGMILLLNKNNFKSNKERIIKISILILLSITVNLIWLKIAGKYLSAYTMGKSSINTSYILSNPFRFFQMLIYSIESNTLDLTTQLFGKYMLWNEVIENNTIIPLSMIILTVLTMFSDETKIKKFNIFEIIIQILIVIVITVLIFTSLYIQWTDFGSEIIYGVQGRYFLPIIPIICIIIHNLIKKRLNVKETYITNAMIITCALVNYIVLAKILIYFI